MTEPTDRAPAGIVEDAIRRFSAGDDESFVACFAPEATVWGEPHLSPVVLKGRRDIETWCRGARQRWNDVRFSHGELSDQGAGAYVELDVLATSRGGGGAWRLPMAVFVQDGLVQEVLPQPDRDAAIGVLTTR